MKPKVFRAFLDRFEDGKAVLLVGEHEEHAVVVPAECVPEDAREGAILTISVTHERELTAKSTGEVEEVIERLRKQDGAPGSDGV